MAGTRDFYTYKRIDLETFPFLKIYAAVGVVDIYLFLHHLQNYTQVASQPGSNITLSCDLYRFVYYERHLL